MLCSYSLTFSFKSASGILNYLNGKSFVLPISIDKFYDYNNSKSKRSTQFN